MGYYATPLDRIFQGINTAMGLAALIKGWRDANAAREQNEATALAKKVDLARALGGGDQPVSLEGGLGRELEKKLGIKLPRQTPETLAQTQDVAIRGQEPGPEQPVRTLGAPGGLAGTLSSTIGGRYETIGRERGRETAEGLAATMPVGGYKPLMPVSKKVGIMQPGGADIKTVTLPPGISEIIQPKAQAEHGIFDVASGKLIPTGGIKPTVVKPSESPEQKLSREKELARFKHDLDRDLETHKAKGGGAYTGKLKVLVDTMGYLGWEPAGENGQYSEEQFAYVRDNVLYPPRTDMDLNIRSKAIERAAGELRYNEDFLGEQDPDKKAAIFRKTVDFYESEYRGGDRKAGAGAGQPVKAGGRMVRLRNPETGEEKVVTEEEARRMGAL